VAVTIAVWLAYALALGQRLRGALIAQRFAWVCAALFVAALISLATVGHGGPPAPAIRAVSNQP
jgi:hypothetical protein